jgi:hypothetical protein
VPGPRVSAGKKGHLCLLLVFTYFTNCARQVHIPESSVSQKRFEYYFHQISYEPQYALDNMATDYLSASPPTDKPASLHDSARGSPEPFDGFGDLVQDINTILGPSNGIDSAGIDVEELKHVMAKYRSCEAEWERYAFADYSRGYTRNLVDNCNGKSNLVCE